jgi:hypothetical protein
MLKSGTTFNPSLAAEKTLAIRWGASAIVMENQIWLVLAQRTISLVHAPTLARVQFSEQRFKQALFTDGYDRIGSLIDPWRPPCAKASLRSPQFSQSCPWEGFSPVVQKLVELKPRHSLHPRSASVVLWCQAPSRSRTSPHLRRSRARVRASRTAEASP